MELRDLAIATHLIGVILWIGGAVTAAMVAASASSIANTEARTAAMGAARRAILVIATPGLLLAFVAGLTFLIPNFRLLYAHAGWMHAKLTLLLILAGLTGLLTGRVRRAAKGGNASAGLFAGLAMTLILGAGTVVFLAILRPGS